MEIITGQVFQTAPSRGVALVLVVLKNDEQEVWVVIPQDRGIAKVDSKGDLNLDSGDRLNMDLPQAHETICFLPHKDVFQENEKIATCWVPESECLSAMERHGQEMQALAELARQEREEEIRLWEEQEKQRDLEAKQAAEREREIRKLKENPILKVVEPARNGRPEKDLFGGFEPQLRKKYPRGVPPGSIIYAKNVDGGWDLWVNSKGEPRK